MKKYFISIHDEDEDVLGQIGTENDTLTNPDFFELVYESWEKYQKENMGETIWNLNDFVEWHNKENQIQIFSFDSDFIQLNYTLI
jgi:hypothetical protein